MNKTRPPGRPAGPDTAKGEPRLAQIVSLRVDIEIELSDDLEQLREAVAAMPLSRMEPVPAAGIPTPPVGSLPGLAPRPTPSTSSRPWR